MSLLSYIGYCGVSLYPFIEFAIPVSAFEQLVELPSGLETITPNFSSSIRCFSFSVSMTNEVDGNCSRDDPFRVRDF